MKKVVLLAFAVGSVTGAFAKVIKINVTDFQFKAKTVNAKVGDTIQWIWKTGTHTTTSTSIPAGATAWNKPIDATHKKFTLVLKKPGTYRYQCNFHFSIGMVGTIKVTTALAAGLQSFDVSDADAKSLLSWKTTSSQDVAYFSVQKSMDGDNFKEIARINPDLSNQYKFTDDNNTPSKYAYYQVELIDTKGNHELTEIKMGTQNTALPKLIANISPNPVSNPAHIMLQFNADKEGSLLVQLYNQNGGFIAQTQMAAYKGLNNGHFHLGDLTPGIYYIVCTLDGAKEKHTIIVK
ncbi:MAG TPA: plastocyanin/azurin family copper-binding protein [Chitinophagaceae bacterium]|jgi:plastocyanin